MNNTVQNYRNAMVELILEQERREKPSKSEHEATPKKEEPKAQPTARDDTIATKKPSKTFELFIAQTQPKTKPLLRVQLLRRLYKRRKRSESSVFKTARMRPSRVWSVV